MNNVSILYLGVDDDKEVIEEIVDETDDAVPNVNDVKSRDGDDETVDIVDMADQLNHAVQNYNRASLSSGMCLNRNVCILIFQRFLY